MSSLLLLIVSLITLRRVIQVAPAPKEGGHLVSAGIYRVLRHPIYTAMFGKLLATNFAFGHWLGLPIAGGVFAIGTMIRIRFEEKLMREAFGSQFEEYASRVPAFIPFVGGGRGLRARATP